MEWKNVINLGLLVLMIASLVYFIDNFDKYGWWGIILDVIAWIIIILIIRWKQYMFMMRMIETYFFGRTLDKVNWPTTKPKLKIVLYKKSDKIKNKTESVNMTEGYCVKCKRTVEMKDEIETTTKKGIGLMKGKCPDCNTTVCRMLGKKKEVSEE